MPLGLATMSGRGLGDRGFTKLRAPARRTVAPARARAVRVHARRVAVLGAGAARASPPSLPDFYENDGIEMTGSASVSVVGCRCALFSRSLLLVRRRRRRRHLLGRAHGAVVSGHSQTIHAGS